MEINQEELTLDDLQNGYYIYQLKDGFRFGVDAVLLSDFADIKPLDTVMDLGTGTGIVPILLAAKTKGSHFTGIDIQERYVSVAQKSVEYNSLNARVSVRLCDIKDAPDVFGCECFDVVTSNPPYMQGNDGLHSENLSRAIARHEIMCSLSDVVSTASKLLKTKGRFFMIHRPYRLSEIFCTLTKYNLEPKRMRLIYPYVDKKPTMVLIEALKGGHAGIVIEEPFIMYGCNGQ